MVAAFVGGVGGGGGVGNEWRGFGVDGPELGNADLVRGLGDDTRTKSRQTAPRRREEEGVPGRNQNYTSYHVVATSPASKFELGLNETVTL
jgi:hypothetical protein